MADEHADVDTLTTLALRARSSEHQSGTDAHGGPALDALLRAVIDDKTLRPTIRRFLFSEDDVATAEQQALVAIAFNLASWSGDGDITPWFRQVAANEAKMIIRARDRRRQYEDAAGNATRDFVERLSSHLATQADVDRCIALLATEVAEALDLRRAGFTYDEIATRLGVPVGTAKTRVRAARKALAELLAANPTP